MEYWRPHAWETLAPAEHARRWAHLAVRPGAVLVVCNIDPLRQHLASGPHGETLATPGGVPGGGGESAGSLCHVQQYQHTPHCTASGLSNAPPNFQCAEVLAALAALLRQLLGLEAGGYVLRSSAGQARFGVWAAERPADASLLSAFSSRVAELPKAPSYALHDAMASAGAADARIGLRPVIRTATASNTCGHSLSYICLQVRPMRAPSPLRSSSGAARPARFPTLSPPTLMARRGRRPAPPRSRPPAPHSPLPPRATARIRARARARAKERVPTRMARGGRARANLPVEERVPGAGAGRTGEPADVLCPVPLPHSLVRVNANEPALVSKYVPCLPHPHWGAAGEPAEHI